MQNKNFIKRNFLRNENYLIQNSGDQECSQMVQEKIVPSIELSVELNKTILN